MIPIQRNEFIDPFKHTMGIEKAVSLFQEIVDEIGLPVAATYTAEESIMILNRMKQRGGLIRIMALNITTRIAFSGRLPDEIMRREIRG